MTCHLRGLIKGEVHLGYFKGGIKKGSTAFDVESKKLDDSAKVARDDLAKTLLHLTMYKKMPDEMKHDIFGANCLGFSPDGGLWVDKTGKLVACFECKKQGTLGNAYERWWDNAVTAKYINPDVVYLTFCSGPGAEPGECLDRLRQKANVILGSNFRFEMSPRGFATEDMRDKMREVLENIHG